MAPEDGERPLSEADAAMLEREFEKIRQQLALANPALAVAAIKNAVASAPEPLRRPLEALLLNAHSLGAVARPSRAERIVKITIAALAAVAAIAIVVMAFAIGTLTPDQRLIMDAATATLVAIAAILITGDIESAEAKVLGIPVRATGGFVLWILVFVGLHFAHPSSDPARSPSGDSHADGRGAPQR